MAGEALLDVDYDVVDEVISQLEDIVQNPQDTYISIGRLRQVFSNTNSDCANELMNVIDKYEDIYNLMLKLASNSINMLSMAKIMYTDFDYKMSAELEQSSGDK